MSNTYDYLGTAVTPEASRLYDVEGPGGARVESNSQVQDQPFTGLDALPIDEFLSILGQRVRARRSKLKMSRKRLAEVSGVSERYLAQLESGQGNMSIALLRKVTASIGVTLSVLLSAEIPKESESESDGSLSKQHSGMVSQSLSRPCGSHPASGRSLNLSSTRAEALPARARLISEI